MKINVEHIWFLDECGFVKETKFNGSLDTDQLPSKGDILLNSYKEKVLFYNLSGVKVPHVEPFISIENQKLHYIYESENHDYMKQIYIKWVSMLSQIQSKSPELNSSLYRLNDDKKVFECLLDIGYKFWGIQEKDVDKYLLFNEKEYKHLCNELVTRSYYSQEAYLWNMKTLVSSVNTFLAKDEILKNYSNNSLFVFLVKERDLRSIPFLSTEEAHMQLNHVLDSMEHIVEPLITPKHQLEISTKVNEPNKQISKEQLDNRLKFNNHKSKNGLKIY
jgi:hypothetical protein